MKNQILLLSLLISLNFSVAQDSQEDGPVNQSKGIGLEGYDAVSYFNGFPLKGKEIFQTEYMQVIYRFDSDENLRVFVENPKKYLPVFGGWCAYAMGVNGELVPIDPETYKIIDGKLYLFYNALFNNTLKKWNKAEEKLLKNAEINWEKQRKMK